MDTNTGGKGIGQGSKGTFSCTLSHLRTYAFHTKKTQDTFPPIMTNYDGMGVD